MSRSMLRSLSLSIVCCWLATLLPALAQASANLSSCFLARGEKALLEVSTLGRTQSSFATLPKFKDFEITPTGTSRLRQIPGRPIEYVTEFFVSSYSLGTHTIPALQFTSNGKSFETPPISFSVFDPNDLTWQETTAGGQKIRYATAFKTHNNSPYVGETTPVEIKLYLPSDQVIEDWGIPDFERNGLTSWRFQPSLIRGKINLLGTSYDSISYPSSLTPSRVGPVSIGPSDIRLMSVQVVIDGYQRRVIEELHVKVPTLTLQAKPLPSPAPEGFKNAVGQFAFEVSCANTDIQEGDPVVVDILVHGSGNLDSLQPPAPILSEAWKLYEPSSDPRGDERRQLYGSTVFHQHMRPLEMKSEIPPFRMVFFNPASGAYETLTSPAIPLQMRPANNPAVANAQPPSALPVPVESMADILSLSERPLVHPRRPFAFQPWFIHALGALISLALLTKLLWPAFIKALSTPPELQKRRSAWRRIHAQKSRSDYDLMMTAGSVIETHLTQSPPSEVLDILAERDRYCFTPDKNASFLTKNRRSEILRILKKALLPVIVLFLTTPFLHAEDSISARAKEAYDSANYDQAIALWFSAAPYQDLSADALYNIGNAYYRSGSAGQAALFYRRALTRNPNHLESRQNLRFIERKYGAISITRSNLHYQLTCIPLSIWQNMAYSSLWLSLISLLWILSSRAHSLSRLGAIAGLIFMPILALSTLTACYFFPTDAEFCPIEHQATIIADHTVAYTEASRTSAEVIPIPPGSICQVLSQSGRWSYISLTSSTCGWVPSEAIEKILPSTPPQPPILAKPKPTRKNA